MDDVWEGYCSHAVKLDSAKDFYDSNEHTFIFGMQIISHIHEKDIILTTNY